MGKRKQINESNYQHESDIISLTIHQKNLGYLKYYNLLHEIQSIDCQHEIQDLVIPFSDIIP